MQMVDLSDSSSLPVLVIGSAGVDVIGRLDHLSISGTSNPGKIRSSFGGVARNVAENLARLGQPVKLMSVVGDDATGDELLQQLDEVGVDTKAVLRTDEYSTGAYLGVVNSNGVLQFGIDDLRATKLLTPEYLQNHIDLFEQASVLFFDANLENAAIKTVISLAKQEGLSVCADPTSTSLADRLCPYMSNFFLITPNSSEASVLCGNPVDASHSRRAIESAKFLVSQGAQAALITLAEFGVVYATSETSGHVPSIRTEILDPTGAGDALTATVIFSILNNISLDDGIRLGVSAATLTLKHRGSVLPDLSLELLYDHLVI
jgi:pseudouridine kinase